MKRDLKKIIAEMTLVEKASLCSGLNHSNTKPIERLGIPSIKTSDGPHGLNTLAPGHDAQDGFAESLPSTCYPSGSALAASWDTDLIMNVAAAIGKEAQAKDVAIVLGPAMNIKRSPLCGRNFEYLSEDPYLTAEMASGYIQGVQSQGVGTSPKHYAVNNQETRRMTVDAVVDERTLREIYLAGFERVIKQSQPWTVMAAYNKVNGIYASEHPYLLNDILRNEWGFKGFVMSDWGAVNERTDALLAGLELEMPGNRGRNDKKIIEAVENGDLPEHLLDQAVERLLMIIYKAVDNHKDNATFDQADHHLLARRTASECMVLLKNDDDILPLKRKGRIAVIGELARKPRYQGGGSSHIVPTQIDIPWEELIAHSGQGVEWSYAQGYDLAIDNWNDALGQEALTVAGEADVAVVFAGLPDEYESESYDRQHMRMPDNHNRLIEEIVKVQHNVVVVLVNGSPIEMPWIGQVKAVLEAYLGGQASGGAIADLLLGDANPCGKLAETFPQDNRHNPSHFNFPGESDQVLYREGLLVGYRHYEVRAIEPLFAFGHGLSYTTFDYTGMTIDKTGIADNETVEVHVTVKNTGGLAGKEVVQLYVRDIQSTVARPLKELKGFRKIHLEPGEEKTVAFTLDKRSFAYYNTELKDWHVETGTFEILVGGSSDQIMLSTTLQVNSTVALQKVFTRTSRVIDVLEDPVGGQIMQGIAKGLSTFVNTEPVEGQSDSKTSAIRMMKGIMMNMPIRRMMDFSQGALTEEKLDELLKKINEAQKQQS